MKNEIHNSSNGASKKEVSAVVVDHLIWIIKLIIRLVVKILALIFSAILYVIKQITNKLKPHFYRLEELLYSRAKDLFGI